MVPDHVALDVVICEQCRQPRHVAPRPNVFVELSGEGDIGVVGSGRGRVVTGSGVTGGGGLVSCAVPSDGGPGAGLVAVRMRVRVRVRVEGREGVVNEKWGGQKALGREEATPRLVHGASWFFSRLSLYERLVIILSKRFRVIGHVLEFEPAFVPPWNAERRFRRRAHISTQG